MHEKPWNTHPVSQIIPPCSELQLPSASCWAAWESDVRSKSSSFMMLLLPHQIAIAVYLSSRRWRALWAVVQGPNLVERGSPLGIPRCGSKKKSPGSFGAFFLFLSGKVLFQDLLQSQKVFGFKKLNWLSPQRLTSILGYWCCNLEIQKYVWKSSQHVLFNILWYVPDWKQDQLTHNWKVQHIPTWIIINCSLDLTRAMGRCLKEILLYFWILYLLSVQLSLRHTQ